MKRLAWILLLGAIALWAGCGDDDSTGGGQNVSSTEIDGALVIPDAWAGKWEITLTFRDCTTDEIRSQEVVTATLCPGDTLVNPFAPIFENCTGTRTGNHVEADCQYMGANGACAVTLTLSFSVDVNGNSMSGSGRLESTATAECGNLLVPGCDKLAIAGTRTTTSTAGCDTLATAAFRRQFLR